MLADSAADPPVSPVPVTSDPKDEFVVAIAKVSDVAASVSGDLHLTELVDLDPPVLKPAAFLDPVDVNRRRAGRSNVAAAGEPPRFRAVARQRGLSGPGRRLCAIG